jgi:hypothetical protein
MLAAKLGAVADLVNRASVHTDPATRVAALRCAVRRLAYLSAWVTGLAAGQREAAA